MVGPDGNEGVDMMDVLCCAEEDADSFGAG